jgi:hypothetical protein
VLLIGVALTTIVVGNAVSAPAVHAQSPAASLKQKPWPRTARGAIALVRANRNTNEEASPFRREITWLAQWRRDRWWVIGLFESPWSVRFVVDAAVVKRHVYTYIDYGQRPSRKWVGTIARRWQLSTLYTRLTRAQAIQFAKDSLGSTLRTYTILDAAGKLAKDTAPSTAWYFVFYVTAQDGRRLVLAVTGLGSAPAEEGEYVGGYGFGSQPQLHDTVPLNLVDWVRVVTKARGWQPSNL